MPIDSAIDENPVSLWHTLSPLDVNEESSLMKKLIPLASTLLLLSLHTPLVFAAEVSGADTAWLLTATALVLFMTIPGLSLFYGGLVRVRNVLSVLMQCFALTALMSLLWFVAGYTLSFGSAGVEQGPWVGDLGNLFLAGISIDGVNGSIPDALFVMFQMTFAIITPRAHRRGVRRAHAFLSHAAV